MLVRTVTLCVFWMGMIRNCCTAGMWRCCANFIHSEIFQNQIREFACSQYCEHSNIQIPDIHFIFSPGFKKNNLFLTSKPRYSQAFHHHYQTFFSKKSLLKVTFLLKLTYRYVIVIHSIVIGTCQKVSPLFPLIGAFFSSNNTSTFILANSRLLSIKDRRFSPRRNLNC